MNTEKIGKVLNFNLVPYEGNIYYIFVFATTLEGKPILLFGKTRQPDIQLSVGPSEDDFLYFSRPITQEGKISATCPLFGDILFSIIDLEKFTEKKEVSKKELEKLIGCDIV